MHGNCATSPIGMFAGLRLYLPQHRRNPEAGDVSSPEHLHPQFFYPAVAKTALIFWVRTVFSVANNLARRTLSQAYVSCILSLPVLHPVIKAL